MKLTHPMIDDDLDAAYVIEIKEGIKHKKIINKFQGWLISMMNNQEADDSTSEKSCSE